MIKASYTRIFCVGLLLTAFSASGQSYPTRPVKMVVPSSAGGMLDTMARGLSQGLSEALGQPFVVETRPGANGMIGAGAVAKAAPDGHTLLYSASAVFVNNPFLYSKLPYDAINDFAPVAMCCTMVQAVVVHPSLKINSLRELIELVKSRPGRLSYGSIGLGSSSNLYMEDLKRIAGMDIVHVPYKGSAPAVTDLLAGRVSTMVVTLGAVKGHLNAGRLKALAVGSRARPSIFPDVPTAAEAGFPQWSAEVWMGVFATGGTPKEIVSKLSGAVDKITGSEEFKKQFLARYGLEAPQIKGADDFANFVRTDMQDSGKMIKALGIRLK